MKSVTRGGICAAALLGVLALARPAAADVVLINNNDWQIFTNGRINGFFSFGVGDGYPQPLAPGETIRPGGGLDIGSDTIPKVDASGNPLPTQGTFRSMRIRSGYLPNVFGLGLRTHLTANTDLTGYISLWTTIEEQQQRKTAPVFPDAREGFARLDGPWGSLLVGRALDLFSRGATENDFLYGHGYSLGFPGNIDNTGPTHGMIGFGVLAAFFSPGIVYTTPMKGGVQLAAGIYDPVVMPGAWEGTRDVRPEAELTYDLQRSRVKLHLFANGAVQKLYRPADTRSATMAGLGYGGRLEVGRFHLGLAGHYGQGLGLSYALENTNTTFDQNFNLRTFDGYSALAQVILGKYDVNVGWGISRVFLLDSDINNPTSSLIKTQIGYSAAVVYHATNHVHVSVDFFRADFAWFLGEKQSVNFVSTGLTLTW